MEKLLSDFGFEWTFFIAQIVNFLILAFIFKRYLYKPILKVLRDREKKIADGLSDAEKARLALEEADLKHDEIIKKATVAAEKILDDTKKSADETHAQLLEKAKIDAQKIISDARTSALEEIEKAKETAEDTAIEISKKVVSKILEELFTKEEKEKILKRDIKRLTDYKQYE